MTTNDPHRFERLPATVDERAVEGRATRAAVVSFFEDRFGIPPVTFDSHTFWEKGAGKVWAVAGDLPSPMAVEALGLLTLRTRQEHWKPTTNAILRFGGEATRNVVTLDEQAASRFVAGEDQAVGWDGDWGYLIAATNLAGERTPIGVGLFLDGELRSQVPKARQVASIV